MEMLPEVGIQRLWVGIGWGANETAPGEYEWSFWDEFVQLAAERLPSAVAANQLRGPRHIGALVAD